MVISKNEEEVNPDKKQIVLEHSLGLLSRLKREVSTVNIKLQSGHNRQIKFSSSHLERSEHVSSVEVSYWFQSLC